MNSSYSVTHSKSILSFIFRWRKVLGIITLASIVLSVIFSSSWFITPKYKSTVIMFPASSNSVSKALMAEQLEAYQDILSFGLEQQSEHMLQILQSSRLRDRVVNKYNLLKHYGLENSKYKYTKLDQRYKDNILFKRNEYMAIEIRVLDEDPQTAASIANFIANQYDSTKNYIQKERASKAFKIVEKEYFNRVKHVQKLEDSLTRLRKLGILDYESQTEVLTNRLAESIANGNKQSIRELESRLNILAKYGSTYVMLRDALKFETEKLSLLKSKYDEAKVDATEVLPQKFVVSYAKPAEKKSYPLIWLIVLTTTFSAMLFAMIVLAIIERFEAWKKEIKKINE